MKKIADTKKTIYRLGPEKAIKACNYQLPIREVANRKNIIIPIELVVLNLHKRSVYLKERCPFSFRLGLGECKCAYHRIENIFHATLERVAGDLESVYGSSFAQEIEHIMN